MIWPLLIGINCGNNKGATSSLVIYHALQGLGLECDWVRSSNYIVLETIDTTYLAAVNLELKVLRCFRMSLTFYVDEVRAKRTYTGRKTPTINVRQSMFSMNHFNP